MRIVLVLAASFSLAGCATTPAKNRLAFLDVSAARGCTVRAQDRPFTLPADTAALKAHLARLAARRGGALIAVAQPEPGFRCRAAFMLSLRTAGFRRLGFLDDFDGPAAED